jgi:hypothetical protein
MTGITEWYRGFRRDIRRDRSSWVMVAVSASMTLALAIPVSVINIFYNEPKINGLDKFNAAAKYLQAYQGTEPAKAIEDAYEIVDTVKGMNPGEEHIVALEAKLQNFEAQVAGVDNPLVYEPVLSDAATAMYKYSSSHDQTFGNSYGMGGITLGMALLDALAILSFFPVAENRVEGDNNANTGRRRQRYDNDLHNTPDDTFRNRDN